MLYNESDPGGATNADTGPNRRNYLGVPLAGTDLTASIAAEQVA